MFKEFGQLLGLLPGWVAPSSGAAAVYGLFKFLDKKASGPAKKTIVAWINNGTYERMDLRKAVIDSFDNLYGRQLLSINGAFRSIVWTASALILYAIVSPMYRTFYLAEWSKLTSWHFLFFCPTTFRYLQCEGPLELRR